MPSLLEMPELRELMWRLVEIRRDTRAIRELYSPLMTWFGLL